MSVRDTSIDPRLLESARKEFMEKGFLKAELKIICDNENYNDKIKNIIYFIF